MNRETANKTVNKSEDSMSNPSHGGVRFTLARAVGSATTFLLQKMLGGNGKNMPGKLALYVDPRLIEHLSYKVCQSVVVVGTKIGRASCRERV